MWYILHKSGTEIQWWAEAEDLLGPKSPREKNYWTLNSCRVTGSNSTLPIQGRTIGITDWIQGYGSLAS